MAEERVEFTKEMKDTHTVLIPNMLPIHFGLISEVFNRLGYHTELLQNESQRVIECGLKYVHNDTCYPALLVIGQFIDALQSGKYDINKTALMITQTGGGCRASNYIHLLRKALERAGFSHVPVISLNASGIEKNSGFKLTLPWIRMAIAAVAYGDILMAFDNQIKPYEINRGDSASLIRKWTQRLANEIAQRKGYSASAISKNFKLIAKDFDSIAIKRTPKVKVGIVGEIYVKYSSLANNELEKFLYDQDCEVMVPGLLGFLYYCIENGIQDVELYGGSKLSKKIREIILDYALKFEKAMNDAASETKNLRECSDYRRAKALSKQIIGTGCKMGEGWLLPAEMMELIDNGFSNIICAQPFGCLPNHIAGKGMIRKIRELHPNANIVPIDYDPGATKVNQENRIKLMLAIAAEELEKNDTDFNSEGSLTVEKEELYAKA